MVPDEGKIGRKPDAGGVPVDTGGERGSLLGPADGNLGFAAAEEERPSLSYWQIVGAQFRKNRLAVASLWVVVALFVLAVYAPLLAFRIPFVYSDGLRQDLSPGDEVSVGDLAFAVAREEKTEGRDTVELFFLVPKADGERVKIEEGLLAGAEEKCRIRAGRLAPVAARFGIFSGRPWVEDQTGGGAIRVNGKPPEERTFPLLTALFNENEFEMNIDRLFNLMMFLLPVLLLAWFLWRRIARKRLRWDLRRTRAVGAAGALAVLALGYFWIAVFPVKAPYRDYLKELHEDGATVSGWGFRVNGAHRSGLFPPIARSYRDQNLDVRLKGPLRPATEKEFLAPYREGTAPVEEGSKSTLLSRGYLAGTDTQGRDVFARLLYGTRISLTIGIFAVAIYVLIGIFFGGLAGYFGGWVDILVMRFIEIMMCFPTFFLILTIISIFESRSIFLIMVIIGVTGWTGVARLVRGEFLKQRTIDYVTAARALGVSRPFIMFKHILPNALAPVLVAATFGIAGAILTESSLSFIGLGDDRAPSWGQLLTDGRASQEYYLILTAGFSIFFTVTILNLVGEGARDALDPKLRK